MTDNDEAYKKGVEDGKQGCFIDDLAQGQNILDFGSPHDKGYWYGAGHRHDSKEEHISEANSGGGGRGSVSSNQGCGLIGCLGVLIIAAGIIYGGIRGIDYCYKYVQDTKFWKTPVKKNQKPTYEVWDQVLEMNEQERLRQLRQTTPVTRKEVEQTYERGQSPWTVIAPNPTKNQTLEARAETPQIEKPIEKREIPGEIVAERLTFTQEEYLRRFRERKTRREEEILFLNDNGETREGLRFYKKSGGYLKIIRPFKGLGNTSVMRVELSNNGEYSSPDNGKTWQLVTH